MINNREYVIFLLGADNFDVSKKIRRLCMEQGMDVVYDKVFAIANTILFYDGLHNNVDLYTNVSRFVEDLFIDDIFRFLQDNISELEYYKRTTTMLGDTREEEN